MVDVASPREPGGFLWYVDHERAPDDGAPGLPAIRWTALWCSLPARPTSVRLATWRDLTRLYAVNLRRSLWAVPHGEAGEPALDHLLDAVSRRGGRARAVVVDGSGPDHEALGRLLADTCEHFWDAFFNDVDRLACRLEAGPSDPPDTATDLLEVLRARYAELMARDIVGSDAAARAARRLGGCADRLTDDRNVIDERERGVTHIVERCAAVAGADGRLRCTAGVRPVPSAAWERAFARFEDYAYRADPTRCPLTGGVFTFRCEAGDAGDQQARLAARVQRFEQSIH